MTRIQRGNVIYWHPNLKGSGEHAMVSPGTQLIECLTNEPKPSRLGSSRDPFGVRSGFVWDAFGIGLRSKSIWGLFEIRSRFVTVCLNSIRGPLGISSGLVRTRVGLRLGAVRIPFGIRLGSVRGLFGIRSGYVRQGP